MPMGPIDTDILKPLPGLGPEIASLSEVLGQIAERRRKQAEAEAHQAFQERQQKAIEEARWRDDLQRAQEFKFRQQEHEDALAHQTALAKAAATQEQQKREDTAFPELQKARKAQDPAGMAEIVGHLGGTMEQEKPRLFAAPQPAPEPAMLPTLPTAGATPFGRFNVPNQLMNAPNQAINDKRTTDWQDQELNAQQAVAEMNAKATKDAQSRYRVQLPASPEIMMSTSAEAQARLNRGSLELKAYGAMKPTDTYEGRFYEQLKPAVAAGTYTAKEALDKVHAYAHGAEGFDRAQTRADTMAGLTQRRQESVEADRDRRMNLVANSHYDTQIDRFKKSERYTAITKAYDEIKKGLIMLDSGALAQKGALEAYMQGARGSMATVATQNYMTKNMAGLWDQAKDLVERWKTGSYSEETRAQVRRSFMDTLEAIRKEAVDPMHQEFNTKFFSKRMYPMKQQAEEDHDAIFERFGYPRIARDPSAPGIDPTGRVIKAETLAPEEEARKKKLEERDRLRKELGQ